MRGAPAKNPVSVCGRGLPPPIGPGIHPNRPRKQGTKHERNNLAARSVLTWYSSSQYTRITRSILGPAVQVPQFLLLLIEVTPQLFIHSFGDLGLARSSGSKTRGRQKKNRRTPPVHLLNLRPTHPPSDFFFLTCF
jgi:hypothetical protein